MPIHLIHIPCTHKCIYIEALILKSLVHLARRYGRHAQGYQKLWNATIYWSSNGFCVDRYMKSIPFHPYFLILVICCCTLIFPFLVIVGVVLCEFKFHCTPFRGSLVRIPSIGYSVY
jgi:hypothetical protein